MKSTTPHKQTSILKSEPIIYHRQKNSQQRNSCIDSSPSSLKVKLNHANSNDNCPTMLTMVSNPAAVNKITNTSAPTRSKNEKYSLRQRQKRLFAVPASTAMAVMSLKSSSNLNNSAMSRNNNNNITSVSKLLNTSEFQITPIPKEKAKNKAAPLSKYRRKTANARERTRMREINSAFENLRRCVPHTITGDESTSSNEKLTKITTLRLAMKYIQILSEALSNPAFQEDFLLECKNDGDHRFTTMDWAQCATNANKEEVQLIPMVATQSRCKIKKSKLPASKTSSRRPKTKTKVPDSISSHLISGSSLSSSLSSSSSSAYASMSTSPFLEDLHSPTDISSMILESDGESLHLSEPCHSPLNRNYNLRLTSSLDGMETLIKSAPMSADSSLELSLRLLDSDSDSLEFSTDQQPSTCISPLVTLETFNPFGDLLHSEFPEHSSLDMFLT